MAKKNILFSLIGFLGIFGINFSTGYSTVQAQNVLAKNSNDIVNYAKYGKFNYTTNLKTENCEGLYGFALHAVSFLAQMRNIPQCDNTFPQGLGSPLGVKKFIPLAANKNYKAPIVIFTGGITSIPANYVHIAKMLASNGYAVYMPYDFNNSTAILPLAGLNEVNNDIKNNTYKTKFDTNNILVMGHSAGGKASAQFNMLPESIYKAINKNFTVKATMHLAPGPLAWGGLFKVPSLILTGDSDFVVSSKTWPFWTEYKTNANVPAIFAEIRGASHLTELDDVPSNSFIGPVLAWADYQLKHNVLAKKWFVGPRWQLPNSPEISFAERNTAAALVG